MIADWLALPAEISEGVFWFLAAASFVTSFITAAFGIGGGGLLLAIMAVLVPTSALIPVHGLVQFGSNAGRALLFLKSVAWSAVPAFALGSLIGSVAGGLVVIELPASIVQIGIGVFVIWTVFARAPRWLSDMPVISGVVSSFLTMFFGATGLFVASFTKSLNLPRHDHVATHAALMTLQHGLKVVVFGFLGFAFAEWGGLILAMIVAGGLGTIAGKRVLSRMDDKGFRFALNTLLVLISLRLIWSGVTGLWRG